MIQSHVIEVESKSRAGAEKALGTAFNQWMQEHSGARVIQLFEPVRWDRLYGDHTYNTYHTMLTFFYEGY